jgi:hypothetical protein
MQTATLVVAPIAARAELSLIYAEPLSLPTSRLPRRSVRRAPSRDAAAATLARSTPRSIL